MSAAATGASIVMVAMSAGPKTEGTGVGVVVVARETVWTRVGTMSVSISMSAPSVAPRTPECAGTVVVVMDVAVEVVRPRRRSMTVFSLATLAAVGTWSMVTRTSMALIFALSAVAVAAVVVVRRIRVRYRGFDVLFRGGGNGVGLGELTDCLGCFGVLWEFLRGVVVTVVTIGPGVRAMSMLSLATFAMEWAWTMVAGASTTPTLALTMSAVVAAMLVCVWGVGVRC